MFWWITLSKKQFVFVYGTLKKGYGNHRLLEGRSQFLGDAVVPGKLYGFGLPGYVMGDEGKVHGELYSFEDPAVLRDLDWLEGYRAESLKDSFYIRSLVTSTVGSSTQDAWVYEINREMNEKQLIPEGVWKRNG